MRIFGMRMATALAVCVAGSLTLAQPGRLMAQGLATIHGHVQNAAAEPVQAGEVRLTTDKNPSAPGAKFEYAFPLDTSGNYKGTGIKPGNYLGVVFQQGLTVDFLPTQIAAGEDKTLDFDMSRKEYIDKMSPADREALEEHKKQAASVNAANAKIENLNALLKTAQADTKAGDFEGALKAMTDATAAKPDEAVLWATLGDAQLGEANAAAKTARANKTTDPSLGDKYAAAEASYEKALSLNAASAKGKPEITAAANNNLGEALGRTGKTKEAADAYEAAAKADPAKAGMYYYNEAATLFNASMTTGKMDGVADAADKAIAADPTKADAYYIKSQALAPLITQTPDGKGFISPPGLVDACNKYLEVAPTGPHAQDMKDLLAGLGEKVQTTYKAPKK